LLQDLDLITNDLGYQYTMARRNYMEYVESQAHQTQTMTWLLTGRETVLDAAKEPF
jgi:hypothetical protein